MKIAIAHYSAKNDISGVTTWLVEFIKFLINNNHDVFLLLHHFDSKLGNTNIVNQLVDLNVSIKRVPRKNLESDVCEVIYWLNSVQPEIFLPQCLHTHHIAASIAGKQKLPWLVTMHSDDPDYWFILDQLKPWCNNAKTVCVSTFLSEAVMARYSLYSNYIFTVPCGVDLAEKQTKWSNDYFRVVYLGRLVETQKQISRVLEVMVSLVKSNDHLDCLIIGDGREKVNLESIVNDKKLNNKIRFTGILRKDEIAQILQESHVIILLSDYEGTPVALMEAMSYGVVPVVREIESGIPELVIQNQTGILTKNDIDEMSSTILDLAKDQNLWEKLSKGSISHIENNYYSKHTFEKYLQIIEAHSNTVDKPKANYKMEKLSNWIDVEDKRLHGYPKRNNTIKIFRKFMKGIKRGLI